jgi:hypothetical protein
MSAGLAPGLSVSLDKRSATAGVPPQPVGLLLAGTGGVLLWMVHVRYRKVNGRRAFPVSISPRDRAGFLRELARTVPGLKVVGKAEDQASWDER